MLLKAVTACSRYFCLPLNLLAAVALPLHAGASCQAAADTELQEMFAQVSGFPRLRISKSQPIPELGEQRRLRFQSSRSRERVAVAVAVVVVAVVVVVVEIFTLQSWVMEQFQAGPALGAVVLLLAKHEAKKAPRSLFSVSCISTRLPKPHSVPAFS